MTAAPQPLVLAGSGGLGREVAAMVRAGTDFELMGFVDRDSSRWGRMVAGVLVLGDIPTIGHYPEAVVALCAGRGRDRQRLWGQLQAQGLETDRLVSVIDPSVWIGADSVIGPGSILLAGCVLTAEVTLGTGCVLMPRVTLTHDDVVEDWATVCAGVSVGGGVSVGERAYIGMGATLRQNVRVGSDATVGMAAAVLRDVPTGETWVGVPARPVRTEDRAGVR